MPCAPIVLFVYNRPDHTARTLEALAGNELAPSSELFVFADGPRPGASPEQLQRIAETRAVVRRPYAFKSLSVQEAPQNKGLAASIISGVTEIVQRYGSVIVLEDDIVTGRYFLTYMNEALERYEQQKSIWHITGWCDPFMTKGDDYAWLYPVMDCWGWATWADRWSHFKKDIPELKQRFTPPLIKKFNINGTEPVMWEQVLENENGTKNTWAIFWYAALFLQGGLCLAPSKSLVRNIGFDNSGEHCGENAAQEITASLDSRIVRFPEKLQVSRFEFRQLQRFMRKKNKLTFRRLLLRKTKDVLRPAYHLLKRLLKL
ncbi:MAG TPA: sugar transferase [Treponema sp.]|nr:sugar transferase [Treponema sp.]